MDYDTKEVRHVHAFIVDQKDAIKLDEHRINFVVSTDVVDRDNEKVLPDAVFKAIHRKDEFSRNPICLPCHQHRLQSGDPPCIGSWDIETAKKRAHHVEMELVFDVEYELGEKYWIVYKNKTMRAVSIGFRVLDFTEEMKDGKRTWIITKIELFEISCVAVGANKQALSKQKFFSGSPETNLDIKQLAEDIKSQIKLQLDEFTVRITDQLDELKDLLITDPDGLADLTLGKESEPPVEGGDSDKTGQALERILKKIQNNNGD